MTNNKFFVIIRGILGFLTVAFGDINAHILIDKIPTDQMSVFHTGVLYHFIHTTVIFVLAFVDGNRIYKSAIFMG